MSFQLPCGSPTDASRCSTCGSIATTLDLCLGLIRRDAIMEAMVEINSAQTRYTILKQRPAVHSTAEFSSWHCTRANRNETRNENANEIGWDASPFFHSDDKRPKLARLPKDSGSRIRTNDPKRITANSRRDRTNATGD